jgi:TRAP-type C4-dicarboxylate transport system substrate-binding protein
MFRRTLIAATIAVATLALAGHASAQQAVRLKGLTPWVTSYYWSEPFAIFQQMVNSRLKGKVEVNYLGGAEVVPLFEQFEAVRNGTVDVILGAASYYTGQIPEAMAIQFAKLPPTKLRTNGYYDLMRKIHLDKGVVYLANTGGSPGTAFRMFVNAKLEKPDFTGLKLRVTPVYVALVKAMGGTPINMAPGEVYTALERKVVDGYGWSYGGIADFGWQEVTKYVIDHPFYTANTAILFNKRVWDGFAPEVKAELEKIGIELEARSEKWMADYIKKEDALLKGLGVQSIKWSGADAERYIKTVYESGWKEYLEKNGEIGAKLKALTE